MRATLRRGDYLFLLILSVSLVLAWVLRHTEDDAFITFRYSKHLAEGLGPIWNPGDSPPVEGYSNFLWMLLMTIPHWLGIDVESFSHGLGLLFWGLNLWVSWRLIQLLIASVSLRRITLLAIGLNYTLLGYATGGMETAMNGFLCSAFFFVVIRGLMGSFSKDGNGISRDGNETFTDQSPLPSSKSFKGITGRSGTWLGILSALLILSRHDNAIFVVLGVGFLVYRSLRIDNSLQTNPENSSSSVLSRPSLRASLPILRKLLSPFILLLSLFILRINYYGEPLPNTFFVKGPDGSFSEGVFYALSFLGVYGFGVLGILLLTLSRRPFFPFPPNRQNKSPKIPALHFAGIAVLLWTVYLILIGGDYMEFRMWVPVIPILVIWLSAWLDLSGRNKIVNQVLIGALVLFSGLHAYSHSRFYQLRFITAIYPDLSEDAPPYLSLEEQGKGIHELFGEEGLRKANVSLWGKNLFEDEDGDEDRVPEASPDSVKAGSLEKGSQSVALQFATGNCGAYAYFNDQIEWVDIYGLNDHWIARNGIPRDFGPGHRNVAPFSHLIDRGVNLVSVACYHNSQLKTHQPYDHQAASFDAVLGNYHPESTDPNVLVLEVPIEDEFTLVCLYLHSHPDIELLIRSGIIPRPIPLKFY